MPIAVVWTYRFPGGNATNGCPYRPPHCPWPAREKPIATVLTTLRRITLVPTVLLALIAAGQAAGAQSERFMFRGEALNAQFSSVDADGILTNVAVYADDQSYNVKGQGGPAERTSSFYVTIEQYDPSCAEGPKLDAQAGGGAAIRPASTDPSKAPCPQGRRARPAQRRLRG